jgi:hypothetical protein
MPLAGPASLETAGLKQIPVGYLYRQGSTGDSHQCIYEGLSPNCPSLGFMTKNHNNHLGLIRQILLLFHNCTVCHRALEIVIWQTLTIRRHLSSQRWSQELGPLPQVLPTDRLTCTAGQAERPAHRYEFGTIHSQAADYSHVRFRPGIWEYRAALFGKSEMLLT